MRSCYLLAAAGLLLAGGVYAAPPSPAEVSNPEITAPEIIANIRYLASDELQGRGSGTSGNNLAGDYLAERFKATGLKPAGENGTYFQKFPVFTGVQLGAHNAVTLNAGPKGTSLKPREQFMPLSFSKNGTASGPLVFAGYGMSRPELGYDDYKGLDVKDRVVVVLRHTPDLDDNGKFAPYAPITYKVMTAREKGAAGVLLVTGPLGDFNEDLGQFTLESASADCGIPVAFVKRAAIEPLLKPAKKSLRDLQVLLAHGERASFAIPTARAALRIDVERQMAPTRNVLGLLEGSDPGLKDEVVVIGAHYDHLGMGSSHSLAESSEPAVHHGADDNASGTAGVLELAQYLTAHRAQVGRSILFMCYSGEELGLLGSRHWTRSPTIPLKRVAAMLNLDMVGRMKTDGVFYVIGAGTSPAWLNLLDLEGKQTMLKPKIGLSGTSAMGGSDDESFYEKGIPTLFFFTGVHPDYHKPSDTWDKINGEGEAKLLGYVADTAIRVSELPQRPPFTKSKEQEPQAGATSFRVYLGTIPDYGEEVEGVLLQGVKEGGPAQKAGIRAGDIIVQLDGKQIRNVQEYTAVLAGLRPNVPTKMVVLRNKQRVEITLTPAPRG